MLISQLFGQTLREAPAEAEIPSHQLLLRAGFIRQHAAGIFSYLHLALRSLNKIENIMRREIDRIGGQEITMPVVNPGELWKETQRWFQIGSELGRFKDKSGRDMALAMTNEEVVADLVRKEIRSYRQLPQLIYHIQTKWRDDMRPRAGLIRAREFTMKDSYSIDADWEGLDLQYRNHYQAYFNLFRRCGLDVISVKADVGMMGGKLSHEFMYLTQWGEDTLLLCDGCGYSANRQVARFKKAAARPAEARPVEKVATPEMKTIEELAQFLGVGKEQTAKAVFMVAEVPEGENVLERFVFAVVRGDMEVNETKLANAVKARDLRPAREEEIRQTGAVPGYASPVGLRDVMVVVDEAVTGSPNLVSGANEEGYHLLNVNYGRDYQANIVADIAAAGDGSLCPDCGLPMRAVRGVEVGNIFQLGTRYSEAMGCTFIDQDGQTRPVIMGSYGIGSGRLLACIAEEHHDDNGLVWPVTVAPFQVHLILLAGKSGEGDTTAIAGKLYHDLQEAGVEVLYDDRPESPGVKFNDADLIGVPVRITVSERAIKQGGVEFKLRRSPEKEIIPLEETIANVHAILARLMEEIESKVVDVPYKD